MSVITEEKENNKEFLDAEDLEYKIEIATQMRPQKILCKRRDMTV